MARLTAPNGATVSVSDEKAKRLLKQGYKAVDGGSSESSSSSVYDGMKPAELATLAEERKLAVEGTGKGGRVVKADLVAALTASDEASDSDAGGDADAEDD